MATLSSTIKSYVAGFLDGDGCIMYQLIHRRDYIYGYQIRASIVFYQKSGNRRILEWLKGVFKIGYLRDRKDGMTEYTIVGIKPVTKILKMLRPYLRLKRQHAVLAAKIANTLVKGNLNSLIKSAKMVDGFKTLNYSKKRTNTSVELIKFLRQHKLSPVTTDPHIKK